MLRCRQMSIVLFIHICNKFTRNNNISTMTTTKKMGEKQIRSIEKEEKVGCGNNADASLSE